MGSVCYTMEIDQHVIDEFEDKVVKHPEGFVNGNQEFQNSLKAVLKLLFDLSKRTELRQFGELPELYVDGFDAEGIWEQIKLREEPLVSAYRGLVTSLENVEPEEGDKQEEDQEDQEDQEEMMEEEGEEEYSEEKEEEEEPNEDENDMMEEDSQSHPATEESEEEKPLDDKTLWEQMQKFGDYEEQMLGKEDSEDESIDMMAPISEQEEEEEEEEEQEEEQEEEDEEQKYIIHPFSPIDH